MSVLNRRLRWRAASMGWPVCLAWQGGAAMTSVTHPSKQLIRAYMERRLKDRSPPPAPADIRRQLGWNLETDAPLQRKSRVA
jgi:hypothetical protein